MRLDPLRENRFLTLAIVLGLGARIAYNALSVLSTELTNWIFAGRIASTERLYPGIYTAGAYMFSLAYRLWLALPLEHLPLESIYPTTQPVPVFQPSLASYFFVFSMKSPIMIFDILILVLIIDVVISRTGSSRTALLAAAAWAWNPLVTLLENYNGIDVSAAFFLLLSAYLFERKKSVFVSFALTVGALLRIAPALFFPAFALVHLRKREWRELLKIIAPGSLLIAVVLGIYAATYGGGILETIIGQRPGLFVYEALAFLGPALKPRLGVAWNGFIAFNVLLYFLLLSLMNTRRSSPGFGDGISSVLLAFFATSWFHFAFFLWVLPFLTIDNLGINRRVALYVVLTAAGLLWTIFQASTAVFTFGSSILFIPVSQDLLPLSRQLGTLQFYKGLEYLRAFLSGVLVAQLALIVARNIPQNDHL